jgi:Ti-type conjugative transfer relaxase TraA
LHTHVIVQNLSLRDDRTTGTIDSAPLYQHKMAAGALYRAELARRLERELGLGISRDKDSFRIEGVSQELCDRWSTRRKEIVEALNERGLSGAKAAAVAAFDTREVKQHVPRVELFQTWEGQGRELSFGRDEALELLHHGRRRTARELALARQEVISRAVTACTKNQSYFTEREMVRFAAVEAQGLGLSGADVLKTVREEIEHSKDIVRLGVSRNEERFTTREMLELERKMLERVSLSRELDLSVAPETVRKISQAWQGRNEALSQEQEAALKHITADLGGVAAVSGMAGAGKSRMLSAAREAWEREGCRVLGAALAGKAAQGLESEAGIKSDTIHKLLSDLEKGRGLGPRAVLVIDEAGMVGTRQMSELVRVTQERGAKLVLVGDERQLQPIDAGGAFKAIQLEIGVSRLNDIRRQRDTWAREAVKEFAFGNARKGLELYAEKGLLSVEDTRQLAQEKLLSDWSVQGVAEPEKQLILAGSNSEVRGLNQGAQNKRLLAGVLGERAVRRGEDRFYEGDRIVFGRNSRLYDVRNGELGTIKTVDESGKLTVEVESGRKVKFALDEYEHVRLGYAVTTHKAQGITVENAYVLAGGSMQDRELSYVQISRARDNTHLYIDKLEAGENLKEMVLTMEHSRAKELALDVQRQRGHERELEHDLSHGLG